MLNKRKELVQALFVADALSFGSHWVYDTEKLADNYSGIIKQYTAPMSKFHKAKKAGDLSHYGEQAFALLKSIFENHNFDLKQFKDDWIEHLENNEMYMDHAMKDSLAKFKEAETLVGAENQELGGIARSLPIFIEKEISKKEFLNLVHLTHNGEVVDQTAEFVFNVIEEVLSGKDYKKVISEQKSINKFVEENFKKIGSKAKIVVNADNRGQGCSIEQGFPIVLDVLWNADNLLEALTLNIMAGGDTSARAMVIAAIMAADNGFNSLPKKLINGFNKAKAVENLLIKI